MPRTVVYRAGGFTNCGIGYTKFSQEELAERRDRAMTENEALEALKLEGGLEITGRPIRVAQFFEGIEVAIKAPEEVQQYRAIGTVKECRAAVGNDAKRVIKKHKVVAPEDIEAFGADALLGRCPVCEELVNNVWNEKYCGDCGQKLDWSDEE